MPTKLSITKKERQKLERMIKKNKNKGKHSPTKYGYLCPNPKCRKLLKYQGARTSSNKYKCNDCGLTVDNIIRWVKL